MTREEANTINIGDRLVVTNGSCKGISIIVTAISNTKKNIWFVTEPYGQMWSHRFCRKFTDKDAQDANVNADVAKGLYMALDIIDKYKAESEE